eukprot:TRINITY_DN3937_c0_g1_i1.p1 TRINITY_DN3937_c0_g1~~TRINITY_DN3937_c0_g1_i1.p1  ORF type:complete len:680 (-),score=105.41 TRINITY_DN3937_c0_g1_i1:1198-3237(-)
MSSAFGFNTDTIVGWSVRCQDTVSLKNLALQVPAGQRAEVAQDTNTIWQVVANADSGVSVASLLPANRDAQSPVENSSQMTRHTMPITYAKLARLPIPDLQATAAKFISTVAPLYSGDLSELKRSVDAFVQGDGQQLHQFVKLYDVSAEAKSGSYIETWWDDMYLGQRDSIMINTSPLFSFQDDPKPERNEITTRAASLIAALMKFWRRVQTGSLEQDTEPGRGPGQEKPLCMFQHARLLGTTRVPGLKRDSLLTFKDARNITVMYRSQMFVLPVFNTDYEPLSEQDIKVSLAEIMTTVQQQTVEAPAVGVLTSDARARWSILRSVLEQFPSSASDLHSVEQSIFVVCLEDTPPTDMTAECAMFLHGDACNRWFDKSIQLVVCSNGRAGITMEHSGYDGHTFLRMANDFWPDAAASTSQADISRFMTKEAPRPLRWNIPSVVADAIPVVKADAQALIASNEICATEFHDFGKKGIVVYKMSPDAFAQMAFQLAYFRLRGRFDCTYEPVMTKTFQHGRTEVLRTVTAESCAFVTAFCSDSASTGERVAALRAAAAQHVKLMLEAKVGGGVDRHLLAMRQIGAQLGVNSALFQHAAYKDILSQSVVSTSNCASDAIRLFGFGPVVDNGFGIAYTIRDNAIGMCVTSKYQGTAKFLANIEQAMRDMRATLEQDSAGATVAAN